MNATLPDRSGISFFGLNGIVEMYKVQFWMVRGAEAKRFVRVFRISPLAKMVRLVGRLVGKPGTGWRLSYRRPSVVTAEQHCCCSHDSVALGCVMRKAGANGHKLDQISHMFLTGIVHPKAAVCSRRRRSWSRGVGRCYAECCLKLSSGDLLRSHLHLLLVPLGIAFQRRILARPAGKRQCGKRSLFASVCDVRDSI